MQVTLTTGPVGAGAGAATAAASGAGFDCEQVMMHNCAELSSEMLYPLWVYAGLHAKCVCGTHSCSCLGPELN